MKIEISMIKIFRVFFATGILLAFLGSLISGAPLYVPVVLAIGGSAMVWFMGKKINSLKTKENGK